jgi:Icc-related predicted phosphoesterase
MLDAAAKMVDYRLIENGAKPLTPRDVLEAHRLDRAWLVNCLSEPFDGKTVVVTHHGPSRRSVSEKYGEMPLNAAFASDLEFLMLHVDLWIHGHTHTSRDYEVAGCRVICNPMGYPTAFGSQENEEFNPQLVVEV